MPLTGFNVNVKTYLDVNLVIKLFQLLSNQEYFSTHLKHQVKL